MKLFRRIVFWLHLVIGVAAGTVIAVMAFTGASIAFRTQITAWAERSARTITPPAGGSPLPLADILRSVRQARPEAHPSAITLVRDPGVALTVLVGRGDFLFVNPYTGEVRASPSPRLRAFFDSMERWHRWLGMQGDHRQVGLAITSACCIAFSILLVSGLYLWWPRKWSLRALRTAVRIRFDGRGKSRDWNWHTTIGFWASPIILLTTLTGLIMAYPKFGDMFYRRPPKEGSGLAAAPSVKMAPGARSPSLDALLAQVEKEHPRWTAITLRLGSGRGGQKRPKDADAGSGAERRPEGDELHERSGGPMPVVFIVREKGTWPAWPIQVSVDPASGRILASEDPSTYPWTRILRTSARSFHTGEAFGPAGQAVVMMSALSALGLIATGFALTWRRLVSGRKNPGDRPLSNEA